MCLKKYVGKVIRPPCQLPRGIALGSEFEESMACQATKHTSEGINSVQTLPEVQNTHVSGPTNKNYFSQFSFQKNYILVSLGYFDYFSLAAGVIIGGLPHQVSGADRRGSSHGGSALVQARCPQ